MSKLSRQHKTNVKFTTNDSAEALNTIHNFGIVFIPILTLAWVTVYVTIRQKLPDKTPNFCMRIVAIIHGIIASYVGLRACMNKGLFDNHLPQTNYQGLMLASSGSFFILYTFWCLMYETKYIVLLFYHTFCSLTFLRAYQQGYSGDECMCMLGTGQSSIPFLYFLWILRKSGYQTTMTYKVGSILFGISFICVRLVLSTILFVVAIISQKATFEYKFMTFMFFVITCYLLRSVRRMYKKMNSTRTKKIQTIN